LKIIQSPLDSKNKRNNQERYVRIAFESLLEFGEKKNRKNYFLVDERSPELLLVISLIDSRKYELADTKLRQLIERVSNRIAKLEGVI
jgi:hypothetical protein